MNTHIHLLAAVSPPTSYVLIFLGILTVSAVLSWILVHLFFAPPPARDFIEPEDDARFEFPPHWDLPQELVSVRQREELSLPAEVRVERWRWDPERRGYVRGRSVPLSRYSPLLDDAAPAAGRPAVWDHQQLFPGGAPLDCALGASPLPAAGDVF